ncbi:MAG: glutaredoxin family protein [Candidatus Heimdallarchaeota archaeon]|nr:glutaredoxin family protein [Candidatus Heimdallarchaeota archaeon]
MSLNSITKLSELKNHIVSVEGTRTSHPKIFTFTISTCQWCKKGKSWLKENGFAYDYIDIDKIPIEEKNALKTELQEVFGVRPRFPFLIVGSTEFLVGFSVKNWEELLL